ncbi:hypothetical protein DL98DRAFT_520013 [Cadophora sp. DSE1049]|nr:hypothetical protein DL98DRAFT_520013 [Cadophora sp. DSE1049]
MRLFDYSFLEEYNSNSSFAVIMPMDNGLSTHEVDIRLARTRKRLIAHCKDLLQVDDEGHGIQSPTVSFIHRSVREIFLQDEVKTHMAKHLKAFNVLDAILQITLAGTKSEPEIRFTVETTQQKRQSLRDLFGFISRFQDQCNDSTWTSLDHIAAAILHRQGVFAGSFHEVSWSKYQVSLWYASRPAFGRRFVVSLVHFAAEMHFDAYLKWTVKKIPDFAEHHEAGTELLVCYVVQHPFGRWSAEGQLWVESMFQKGLSANCPLYSSVAAYSVSKRSPRLDQRLVWFWLLENLVRYPDHRNSEIWQVIEIFLQYGADCSSVMKLGTEFGTYPAEKRLRWAGTTITLHEGISVMSEVLKNRAPNTVRFQDFVDFWAPPNATALKKLIVRNQTREAESPSVVTLSIQDFEHRWNTSSDLYSVVFQMREANWEVSPPTRLELTEGVGS